MDIMDSIFRDYRNVSRFFNTGTSPKQYGIFLSSKKRRGKKR